MRWFISILPAMALALTLTGCKQSSTVPEVEISVATDISVTCSPGSGGTGTVLAVSIFLDDIDKEIKVFGMDMTFEADQLQFQGTNKGNLTGDWAAVDANEISAGTLRIGGYAGSGTQISPRRKGTIAEVRLKAIGGDFSDGQKSQICINNFTDDISGLNPMPACTTFELKK